MLTLTARTLITAIGTVAYPVITVDAAGLIEDISTDASSHSASIFTATFFDIHIHGGVGVDVMQATPADFARLQRSLATRGTGHYLPTTVTASIDQTLRALETIAQAIERPTPGDEATPLGIHLEGPFLSHAKRGVHPAALLQPPSIALFERFQQAARGHIRLLTLAPEPFAHAIPMSDHLHQEQVAGLPHPAKPAEDLIRHAVQQGVRVSLGHSNATAAQAQAAIAAGASSATHTFNAMRALDHREPGILGAVLDHDKLYAELICDGVHVAPALVRLWLKLKQDHAILVTDGISATGMPEGEYALGHLAVTVREGRCTLADAPATLAGSVLTLDRAVANLMHFTSCSLETAVRAASSQPARMLGLDATVGSLRTGQPASFNQYSAAGQLEATYLHGRRLQARHS